MSIENHKLSTKPNFWIWPITARILTVRSDLRWKRCFLPVAAISSPPISINLPPSQPLYFYCLSFTTATSLFFFISYCSTTILFSHLHYQSVVLHRPLSADPRLFQTSECLKYEEIALSLLWNLQLFGHLSLTDTWGTKKKPLTIFSTYTLRDLGDLSNLIG